MGVSLLLSNGRARLLVLAAIIGAAFAITGCDDFYSDSLPTNSVPTPTRSANAPVDARAAIEESARTAIADRIGVSPETPRLISMSGATWTNSNPGCFPFAAATEGSQIVPGVTATFEYENVRYRYDSNETGDAGALCDSTRRVVAASSAASLFEDGPPVPGDVTIMRSQDEAAAFLAANPGISFDTEVVDWPNESLGAASVELSDITLEPLIIGARLSEDGSTVVIELEAYETTVPQPGTYGLWVYLEDIGDADSLEVEMSVTGSAEPSETPPAFNFPQDQ